jgi:predicted Zn-dependent protease
MKQILFLMMLTLSVSCTSNKSRQEIESRIQEVDSFPCCCPHANIWLQPYGDFTEADARRLCHKIEEGLYKVYDWDFTIKVLPNKPLPADAYYEPRKRYLAPKLLDDLSKTKFPDYVVGLTHKDISTEIHGQKNYGIMGLARLGKRQSVVSDYRAKGDNFIAVIVHEFGHCLGADHCQDPDCIMCDFQYLKGKKRHYGVCKRHEYIG